MTQWRFVPVLIVLWWCVGCGSGTGPTAPSGPSSFLAGTWQGTLTIQVNPDVPGAPPASTSPTTWTFNVVPQTNLQTFTANVRSEHPWLPVTTIGTTALVPSGMPPAQISTQGDYSSPRGCRGTYGSFGQAEATRIDANFSGVDCNNVTFTGRVVLTKQ
jgi:hypothetical protein